MFCAGDVPVAATVVVEPVMNAAPQVSSPASSVTAVLTLSEHPPSLAPDEMLIVVVSEVVASERVWVS